MSNTPSITPQKTGGANGAQVAGTLTSAVTSTPIYPASTELGMARVYTRILELSFNIASNRSIGQSCSESTIREGLNALRATCPGLAEKLISNFDYLARQFTTENLTRLINTFWFNNPPPIEDVTLYPTAIAITVPLADYNLRFPMAEGCVVRAPHPFEQLSGHLIILPKKSDTEDHLITIRHELIHTIDPRPYQISDSADIRPLIDARDLKGALGLIPTRDILIQKPQREILAWEGSGISTIDLAPFFSDPKDEITKVILGLGLNQHLSDSDKDTAYNFAIKELKESFALIVKNLATFEASRFKLGEVGATASFLAASVPQLDDEYAQLQLANIKQGLRRFNDGERSPFSIFNDADALLKAALRFPHADLLPLLVEALPTSSQLTDDNQKIAHYVLVAIENILEFGCEVLHQEPQNKLRDLLGQKLRDIAENDFTATHQIRIKMQSQQLWNNYQARECLSRSFSAATDVPHIEICKALLSGNWAEELSRLLDHRFPDRDPIWGHPALFKILSERLNSSKLSRRTRMKLYIALIEHGPRERCADWIEKLAQDFWVLSKRQLSELTRAIGTIGEDHPINERYYSNILSEFAKPLHIQMWLGFAAWIGRRLEG